MRDNSCFVRSAAALAQRALVPAVVGGAVAGAGLTAALQTQEASTIGAQDAAMVAAAADQRACAAVTAEVLAQRAIGHPAPAAKA